MTTKLLRWANSPEEAAQLQAEGWVLSKQRLTHHAHFSVLLEKDEPVDESDAKTSHLKQNSV